MNLFSVIIIVIAIICNICNGIEYKSANLRIIFDSSICERVPYFNEYLKYEIRNKSQDVNRIIDFVLNGPDKGVTYNELGKFVDEFGSRLAGTKNLENAIDYMLKLLQIEKHDNVHGEKVQVPVWVNIININMLMF